LQSIYCKSFDIKKLAIELGTGRVGAQYSQYSLKNICTLFICTLIFSHFRRKMFICFNKKTNVDNREEINTFTKEIFVNVAVKGTNMNQFCPVLGS